MRVRGLFLLSASTVSSEDVRRRSYQRTPTFASRQSEGENGVGGGWGREGGGESHVISRRKAWLAPERQCFMGQNCVTDGSLNYKVRARLKSRG